MLLQTYISILETLQESEGGTLTALEMSEYMPESWWKFYTEKKQAYTNFSDHVRKGSGSAVSAGVISQDLLIQKYDLVRAIMIKSGENKMTPLGDNATPVAVPYTARLENVANASVAAQHDVGGGNETLCPGKGAETAAAACAATHENVTNVSAVAEHSGAGQNEMIAPGTSARPTELAHPPPVQTDNNVAAADQYGKRTGIGPPVAACADGMLCDASKKDPLTYSLGSIGSSVRTWEMSSTNALADYKGDAPLDNPRTMALAHNTASPPVSKTQQHTFPCPAEYIFCPNEETNSVGENERIDQF